MNSDNDMILATSPTDKKNKSEEFIYQHLSDAILEQRLSPGTKLTEESLSDIFGASRTVIRRALTRLNYENVVEIRPNRGAIVACPTIKQALQVFEARQIIEKAVIRNCVKKHTQHDLKKLEKLVLTEKRCAERNERVAWIRLTGNFHLEIARIAGNDVISRFLKELVSQTSLIIALYGNTSGSLCSNDDHHLIVEAIGNRDEQRAIDLMLHHLDECGESLNMENKEETQDLKSIFSNIDT